MSGQNAIVAGDDEWEYEYSATETETYYLTLDLSQPDFLERREEDVVHNTRSGYKVWFNPLVTHPDETATRAKDPLGDEDEQPDSNNGDIEQLEVDDDADPLDNLDRPSRAHKKSGTKELDSALVEHPATIQVHALHSMNPIVAYRGQYFSGTWEQTIGTELLFTPHDAKTPLPALRHLPQDVDLIAASSARIAFRRAVLEQHADAERRRLAAPYDGDEAMEARQEALEERYRRNGGVFIHVTGDKSRKRRPQAAFLENLIALKRRRGESDRPTVVTRETRFDDVEDDDEEVLFQRKKRRDALRHRNLGVIKAGVPLTGAQRRRRRGTLKFVDGLERWQPRTAMQPKGVGATGQPLQETGSAPTMVRWADLDHGQGRGDYGRDQRSHEDRDGARDGDALAGEGRGAWRGGEERGYNEALYDKGGYAEEGYNEEEYDEDYEEEGYDEEDYDEAGYDEADVDGDSKGAEGGLEDGDKRGEDEVG